MSDRRGDDDAPLGMIGASYAARRLGIQARTLRKWIDTGRVRGEKVDAAEMREPAPPRKGTRARWYIERGAFNRLRALLGRD